MRLGALAYHSLAVCPFPLLTGGNCCQVSVTGHTDLILKEESHGSWVLPNNKLHSGLVMWTRDKQHLSLQDVCSQSQLPHVLSPAWFWFPSDSSARLGESHFIWGFLMLDLSQVTFLLQSTEPCNNVLAGRCVPLTGLLARVFPVLSGVTRHVGLCVLFVT